MVFRPQSRRRPALSASAAFNAGTRLGRVARRAERLHAPHSRREFRILNVQFDVGGELAVMTVGAQVVGTRHFRVAYGSQDRLGTQFLVASLVAASARNGPLAGRRGWKPQQFCHGCCARLMHG
jgi:hypothetical protein